MSQAIEIGAEFARALAAKDSARLLGLMHPEIDFRGLTPNRSWEANDRDAVVSVLLDQWFEDSDDIEALEQLDSDVFADRQRVGYRYSVSNPDGRFLVEQQAYWPPPAARSSGCACSARATAKPSQP